jgi:hypothetical protein
MNDIRIEMGREEKTYYCLLTTVRCIVFFYFHSWFEGDYSSPEAQEALSGQKPGTFLVRFSSQAGSYAVYV